MQEFAYDITQYESYPYSQTHPEHLYTVARLFGLEAPNYKKGRILELGCASGGNIIPIAFNYPDCQIVGVDFSKKQAEKGQKQIQELGLKNIIIDHMSIADIDESFGRFDYIICHGVFSWVQEAIQKKIFSVIRENLSENGIAYVSYNTLPGWNIVKSYRDMMRYHIRDFDTLEEKAEQARSILKFMAEGQVDSSSGYSQFLISEYELLSERSDSYLLHDHLADLNSPIYFYEFMDEAAKCNLYYLADTPVSNMYSNNLPESVAKKLGEISDLVQAGQYMDFFRNQRFRCTILCHEEAGRKNVRRSLKAEDVKNYYLTFEKSHKSPNEAEILSDEFLLTYEYEGLVVSFNDIITRMALKILDDNKLKPVSYNELCSKIAEKTGVENKKIRNHLEVELNLMRLVFAGIIGIHSEPGNYVIEKTPRPCASLLSRYQAVSQCWVTSQRHESISLNLFDRTMIQYMDGSFTYQEIFDRMCQHVFDGDLEIYDDLQVQVIEKEMITRLVDGLCKTMIEYSIKNALLVG